MKLHIGVDSQAGLTHSAVVTAANRHVKHPLPDTLHGQERRVYGDSARQSEEADRRDGALSQGIHHQRTRHTGVVNDALKTKNRNK